MSFTPAKSYVAKSGNGRKSSITAAVRVRASDCAVSVTFGITVKAQEVFFGGSLAGRRIDVGIGRGADHGRVRLKVVDEGGVEVGRMPKGAVSVKVAGWDLVAPGAHPASPLRFACNADDGVVFDLPEWGQRGVAQERLSREFGLKPVGGGIAWPC